MKEKKFTYSKIIPIVTGIIFVACLVKGLDIDFTTVMDTTVYVASITISGSIFGSTLVWYSKKAMSENNIKIKAGLYRTAIDERLRYNEEMMKLKDRYGYSQEELDFIDSNGDADDFMNSALNDVMNSVDNAQSEADAPNELQSF